MKKGFFWVALVLGLLLNFNLLHAQVVPVQDGDKYSISFDDIELVVDAGFGARITSFKLGDAEMLVPGRNMTGSTLWTSPQDDWGWPPLETTDSDSYTARIEGDKMVFESGEETGLAGRRFKFIKTFSANEESQSVSIRYALVNTGTRNISTSLWAVTRVEATGLTFWKAGDKAPWTSGSWSSSLKNAVVEENDYYWIQIDDYSGSNNKFFSGIDETGWFGHVNDNRVLFLKSFADVASSDFAPGEAEFEYYMGGSYVELENQGKYTTVLPGDTLNYDVTWFLRLVPEDIDLLSGSTALAEFAQGVADSHTTGVNDLVANGVKMYPNPVHDLLTVQLPANSAAGGRLSIYNLSGSVLQYFELGQETQVDVSSLKQGIYFYTLQTESGSTQGKLVKK